MDTCNATLCSICQPVSTACLLCNHMVHERLHALFSCSFVLPLSVEYKEMHSFIDKGMCHHKCGGGNYFHV